MKNIKDKIEKNLLRVLNPATLVNANGFEYNKIRLKSVTHIFDRYNYNGFSKIFLILLVSVILFYSVSAQTFGGNPQQQFTTGGGTGSFASSNPQFTQPGFGTYSSSQLSAYWPSLYNGNSTSYNQMCLSRQDFIIQIAPGGCSPVVVRSDLLAQQNVPVFCQLQAVLINPSISVSNIQTMTFSYNGQTPKGVTGVTYFNPARMALSSTNTNNKVGFPTLNNIGYAVIILQRQPNETALPNFVQGNLSARISYDAPYGFGLGVNQKVLSILTDADWKQRYTEFAFFNGKGYLRLQSIDQNSITVGVYSDVEHQVDSFVIQKGKTSDQHYLPGFYCQAAYSLSYTDSVQPQNSANIIYDQNQYTLYEGDKFGADSCVVTKITPNNNGGGSISGSCQTSTGAKTFTLQLGVKKIKVSFDGSNSDGYNVGDKLYSDDKSGKDVYLGFVGSKVVSGNLNNYAVIISIPTGSAFSPDLKKKVADYFSGLNSDNLQTFQEFFKYNNIDYRVATIKQGDTLSGFDNKDVSFSDFISGTDVQTGDSNFENSFLSAIGGYQSVFNNYADLKFRGQENMDSGTSYGQNSLQNAISLARNSNKGQTLQNLIQSYKNKYGDSNLASLGLINPVLDTSQSTFVFSLYGQTHTVSLSTVLQPDSTKNGVELSVDGTPRSISGSNDYIIKPGSDITSKTSIQLNGFDESGVKIIGDCFDSKGASSGKVNDIINLGSRKSICGHDILVNKINIQRVAKITLTPISKNLGSVTNFSYAIGIEKRAIQLNPDQTKQRIAQLNQTIAKWQNISQSLATAVSTLKAACFATSAALQVKNLFSNLGGKAIARQSVMQGKGGWDQLCAGAMASPNHSPQGTSAGFMAAGPYASLDDCYSKNNANIENDVNLVSQKITQVNTNIKNSQTSYTTSGSLGKSTDVQASNTAYITSLRTNLQNSNIQVTGSDGKPIAVNKVAGFISPDTLNPTQARDLDLYTSIYSDSSSSASLKNIASQQIAVDLNQINSQYNTLQLTKQATDNAKASGIVGSYSVNSQIGRNGNTQVEPYTGGVVDNSNNFKGLAAGDFVQGVIYNGQVYNVKLKQVPNNPNQFIIDGNNIFNSDGSQVSDTATINGVKTAHGLFQKFDSGTYQNAFQNPQVSYFETGNFKGMPAIVPFDLKNGWYAAVQQTTSLGSVVTNSQTAQQGYQASGRVSSFWLCNVGKNGIAEFNSGFGDDLCQQFNLNTGQPLNQFSGLSNQEASQKVSDAQNAIQQAANQYAPGVKTVTILGQRIPVGNPATGQPGVQCQDFMSPSDCKLMFNVCDPVICPSSRCNLGGQFYVDNVVQSGIGGSLFLCLPNYKEGIVVPICLTGVQAGVDNYVSIMKAYRDCLQVNLNSGQYVGICDEITAVYSCEFFWKQIAPIANVLLPKFLEFVTGQSGNSRGGGEYLNVQSAWQNTQNSINYFTNVYGVNALQAYQIRSTQDVGTAVCKSFVSLRFPSQFQALIAPDSPTQFSAWFSEIPMSTATVPATSQYQVFYHIFAGNDQGAYYSVYLKNSVGQSFYVSTGNVVVDTGFIVKGQYADQTKDITAPAGFQQLCVMINGQEKCGFKQVSTSAALNYIQDQYVKGQITNTQITSSKDCVSGTPSILGAVNPNIQNGVQNAIQPQIYNNGIIRVCATNNPGSATDSSRWQNVGYCDNTNVICWLDRNSVTNAISPGDTGVRNATISQLNQAAATLANTAGFSYLDPSQEDSVFAPIENSIIDLKNKPFDGQNIGELNSQSHIISANLQSLGTANNLLIQQKARVAFDQALLSDVVSQKYYLYYWQNKVSSQVSTSANPNLASTNNVISTSGFSGVAANVNILYNVIDFTIAPAQNELNIAELVRKNNIQIWSGLNQVDLMNSINYFSYSSNGLTCSGTCLGRLQKESLWVLIGLGLGVKDTGVLTVTGAAENTGVHDVGDHPAGLAIDINGDTQGREVFNDFCQLSNDNFQNKYGFPKVGIVVYDEKTNPTNGLDCNGHIVYTGAGKGHYHVKIIPSVIDNFIASGNTGSQTVSSTSQISNGEATYSGLVVQVANQIGVDPNLLKAVAKKESSWNPSAQSSQNAFGLMQIEQITHDAVVSAECKGKVFACNGLSFNGWNNLNNPSTSDVTSNVQLSACYLKCLSDYYHFSGNEIILAAYNAGPNAIISVCPGKSISSMGCNIPNQDYVNTVMGYYNSYSSAGLTTPAPITKETNSGIRKCSDGDVNGDGKVDNNDVLVISNYINRNLLDQAIELFAGIPNTICDVNGDDKIDSNDIQAIRSIMAGSSLTSTSSLDIINADTFGLTPQSIDPQKIDAITPGTFDLLGLETTKEVIIAQPVQTLRSCPDGDVDGNKKTDSVDIQILVNVLLGKQQGGCDVNGDGKLDVTDLQLVINMIFGNTLAANPYPYEFEYNFVNVVNYGSEVSSNSIAGKSYSFEFYSGSWMISTNDGQHYVPISQDIINSLPNNNAADKMRIEFLTNLLSVKSGYNSGINMIIRNIADRNRAGDVVNLRVYSHVDGTLRKEYTCANGNCQIVSLSNQIFYDNPPITSVTSSVTPANVETHSSLSSDYQKDFTYTSISGTNYYPDNGGRVWISAKTQTGESYPLIIFLHGCQNSPTKTHLFFGDKSSYDIIPVAKGLIDSNKVKSVILAAPSQTKGTGWNNDANGVCNPTLWASDFDINQFIIDVKANLPSGVTIDDSQISIVGHSGAFCNDNSGITKAVNDFPSVKYIGLFDTCALPSRATLLKSEISDSTELFALYGVSAMSSLSDRNSQNSIFGINEQASCFDSRIVTSCLSDSNQKYFAYTMSNPNHNQAVDVGIKGFLLEFYST